MGTEVINSYNFFIDSERGLNVGSTGDSLFIPFNHQPITCGDNEFIKMSLQTFNMYKSFTNVNPNNNVIRVTHDAATPRTDYPIYLPPANYPSLYNIAFAFATSLGNQLIADIGGGITYGIPNATLLPRQSGVSDNIISFKLLFSGAHGLTNLQIRTLVSDGDSFEILGTERIKKDDGTAAWHLLTSAITDITTANEITVECFFGGQTSSKQNIFLRTDMNSTNIQTESFVAGNTDTGGNQISSSTILASMIVDNDSVNFNTGTKNEYEISLTMRQLTHMRLFLTDSHGRKIPENVRYVNNVPVYSTKQGVLGNRSFQATIKIEIVRYVGERTNVLVTEPIKYSIPPRFSMPPITPNPFPRFREALNN